MYKGLYFISLLVLSACALEPSYRATRVMPAYPPMVAECTFLGGVVGESSIPFLDYGEQEARYQALDQAANIGATHVVWTERTKSWKVQIAGRAYRCEE